MQIRVDVDQMRRWLMEQRKVITRQVEVQKKKVLPKSMANQDRADLAYDYAYRAHRTSVLERLENQLLGVVNAQNRTEDGTYGICANCGEAILLERLEAPPYAELCISCQIKV